MTDSFPSQFRFGEARALEEQDASRRKQIEDEIKQLKALLQHVCEKQRMQATQQRARESELENRLQTEQSKLDDLNDRLNTLERLLDGPKA